MSLDDALGLELRFRREARDDADTWARALTSIAAWNAALRPVNALRLNDPDQQCIPWTPAVADAIIRACAAGGPAGWMLNGPDDGPGAIKLHIGGDEVQISLALPRPGRSLPDALRDLLYSLNGHRHLAVAMAFDLNDRADAELVLQGLHGIDRIAPLVYLDEAAIRCAGGRQHVLAAPCVVGPAPGGLLLEVEADPWRAHRDARLQRAAAVARYLGIRPGNPLVLVET